MIVEFFIKNLLQLLSILRVLYHLQYIFRPFKIIAFQKALKSLLVQHTLHKILSSDSELSNIQKPSTDHFNIALQFLWQIIDRNFDNFFPNFLQFFDIELISFNFQVRIYRSAPIRVFFPNLSLF